MTNKKNGIYYTPAALADFLVKPLIGNIDQKILDPSYGEGSLLLAAERAIIKKRKIIQINLFGCDIQPVNGLLSHLPAANLKEIDFFDYSLDNLFHTIIMNPPYVRHQIQNLLNIDKYRKVFTELKILNNNADLWAFFLVKAVSHLEKGGSIGAILPWAFLQADYSVSLRKWLANIFKEIKVLALSDKYFEKADERIIVIWLTGYGQKNTTIKVASSRAIDKSINYSKTTIKNWSSDRVIYSGASNIQRIFDKYISKFGFTNFGDSADVKIGVVTGAVDYFILSKQEAKLIGFDSERLIPILKSTDEFASYIKNGEKGLKLLATLKNDDHILYKDFIKKGITGEYHLRRHSIQRDPWYSVKVGQVPDAFFHYRISKTPYLLPNIYNIQCTNSIHRIYYKNITENEKRWITVSILSKPSQLSLEINAKTYGRGVLKIEPKSLKNTLVIKRNDPIIIPIYDQVITLLAENNKEMAMQIATKFIYEILGFTEDLKQSTNEELAKLQNLRLSDINK